jgi:hypothetical protein
MNVEHRLPTFNFESKQIKAQGSKRKEKRMTSNEKQKKKKGTGAVPYR